MTVRKSQGSWRMPSVDTGSERLSPGPRSEDGSRSAQTEGPGALTTRIEKRDRTAGRDTTPGAEGQIREPTQLGIERDIYRTTLGLDSQ